MSGIVSAAFGAESQDRYLTVARRAADALLAEGRDDYGPQKSALILSVLDPKTGRPLSKLPKAPSGVRGSDRCPPYGSNANLQQDLYRTLDELSRITGDPRYVQASHAALVDFLRMTQHPETGLLAWGEHLCWDCQNDRATAAKPEDKLIHEPKRGFLYFDLLYQAEPARMLKYARGLWDHQIADHRTGDFSRHAAYDKLGPGRTPWGNDHRHGPHAEGAHLGLLDRHRRQAGHLFHPGQHGTRFEAETRARPHHPRHRHVGRL